MCAAQASGGLVAFDLDTFLDLAARTRKWQCPHSMQPGAVQDLVVDGFVQSVLASLQVSSQICGFQRPWLCSACSPACRCVHALYTTQSLKIARTIPDAEPPVSVQEAPAF